MIVGKVDFIIDRVYGNTAGRAGCRGMKNFYVCSICISPLHTQVRAIAAGEIYLTCRGLSSCWRVQPTIKIKRTTKALLWFLKKTLCSLEHPCSMILGLIR